MADQKNTGGESNPTVDPADVQRIEREQLAWSGMLKTWLKINEAQKVHKNLAAEISKLEGEQVTNARAYKNNAEYIARAEKSFQTHKALGNTTAAKSMEIELKRLQQKQAILQKTEGGALRMQEMTAAKQKANLKAEQALVSNINKERGVGAKLADLFRTKEQKQRSIDIARAKAGGGANITKVTGGKGGAEGDAKQASSYGALITGIKSLEAPFKAAGKVAKDAIVAPFAEAAALVTGESYGMGGGKANAGGATSILGGLEKIASTLPLIGGIAGGLIGLFKGIVDAVLGVDQANFRVARSMNISAEAANQMRKDFTATAMASGNIVVNSTRMLQSQIEIGNQLGINKQLSDDILINDVKLRDILGLEAESRKLISDQAIITGRNAKELTQSAIGTVESFNQQVGTIFKWSSIF